LSIAVAGPRGARRRPGAALADARRQVSARISARSISGSTVSSESARVTSSPVGSSSERVRRALKLWMVARTSSTGAWTAVAISWTVGERLSSWVSLSRALITLSWSSCMPRGTRIAHVLSRKWRLSSPSTVGVA
jgi:hypothetical protein